LGLAFGGGLVRAFGMAVAGSFATLAWSWNGLPSVEASITQKSSVTQTTAQQLVRNRVLEAKHTQPTTVSGPERGTGKSQSRDHNLPA
jgi:hypothetical protein